MSGPRAGQSVAHSQFELPYTHDTSRPWYLRLGAPLRRHQQPHFMHYAAPINGAVTVQKSLWSLNASVWPPGRGTPTVVMTRWGDHPSKGDMRALQRLRGTFDFEVCEGTFQPCAWPQLGRQSYFAGSAPSQRPSASYSSRTHDTPWDASHVSVRAVTPQSLSCTSHTRWRGVARCVTRSLDRATLP